MWCAGPALELDDDELGRVQRTNVMAPLALLRALLPRLPRGGGALVVGSLAGFMPIPGLGAYAGSKGQLNSQTLALREEVEGRGVNVSLLAPGLTRTEFLPAGRGDIRRKALEMLASRPETVARAGYLGCISGQGVIVPGLFWRLAYFGVRILPASIVAPVAGWAMSPLHDVAAPGHDAPATPGRS